MLRVEFHCHTIFSKDSLTKPETLVEVCRKRGIDRVIITDHNSIAGALAAREIDPTRVIVGEEIMTTRGEILAAFVQEEIAPGQTPQAVIDQLRQQGAFISVSHPFDRLRSGHWDLADLEEITPEVDAIEIFNSRCMESRFNQQALEYAQKYELAGTVGSDAHAPFELGRATLSLPDFNDADELRTVIRSGKPDVHLSSPFVHFTSRYAVWKKAGKARNPEHQ